MSRSQLTRRTRRRSLTAAAATVVAALATLVGGAAAAQAAPGDDSGWIRAGHLAPRTPEADVRLTSFAGGDVVTLKGVGYGEISDYSRVPTGLYTVALTEPAAERPMVSRSVRVTPGSAITVVATGQRSDVRTKVVYDDLTPPPAGQARVRLLSGTAGGATVDAQVVDGPLLAEDVAPGTATGYAEVDAQTWSIELTGADQDSSVTAVPVRAGGVYTLLALDASGGELVLEPVVDSAGTTSMPSGGVETGGGGLATTRETSADPAAGDISGPLALTALVLVGGLIARMVRRRAHAGSA